MKLVVQEDDAIVAGGHPGVQETGVLNACVCALVRQGQRITQRFRQGQILVVETIRIVACEEQYRTSTAWLKWKPGIELALRRGLVCGSLGRKGPIALRKPRGPKPTFIELTERQRAMLEQIIRRTTSPQRLVTRSKIILKAAVGKRNQEIADELAVTVQTPRRWRERWAKASTRLAAAELDAPDAQLFDLIAAVLTDKLRSGTPATFTAEQICQIVAIACENPQESGRPVTEWTPTELADEAVQRDIVSSISPRSVGRFLKGR